MRTNIVLDEDLVAEAFKHADVKTKRELVDLALREFVAARTKRDMRELRGKISFAADYDHKAARSER